MLCGLSHTDLGWEVWIPGYVVVGDEDWFTAKAKDKTKIDPIKLE